MEQKDAEAPASLTLNLDKLSPIDSQVELERKPSSQETFSIQPAVLGAGTTPLRVYWFIDYNSATPTVWTSEQDPFTLPGCHTSLLDNDNHVLEAWATTGELEVTLTGDGDKRSTVNGEPYVTHTWVIHVTGAESGCQVPEATTP